MAAAILLGRRAGQADPGCFHPVAETPFLPGTTITAPPQYFYVWDALEGNNRSVISFTQLAPCRETRE